MAKRFKLTDDSLNTYGFRILTDGIDISQFEKNPVMLYDHDSYTLPIGRWTNIKKEDGAIYADAEFDLKDKFAAQVAGKVEDGFINMCSISIYKKEESVDESVLLPGQIFPTITKSQLKEVSITPFGANHNALKLYSDDGSLLELNNKNLNNVFKTKITTMKKIKEMLQLAENANEADVENAVQALQQRAENAERKLREIEDAKKASQKKEAEALVDNAIKEQRINASAKDAFLQMFDSSFENAKKVLSEIPKRKTAKDIIENGEKGDEKLLSMSWDELDKSNRLQELKDKYPDVFEELKKEKFKNQ